MSGTRKCTSTGCRRDTHPPRSKLDPWIHGPTRAFLQLWSVPVFQARQDGRRDALAAVARECVRLVDRDIHFATGATPRESPKGPQLLEPRFLDRILGLGIVAQDGARGTVQPLVVAADSSRTACTSTAAARATGTAVILG